MVDDADRFDGQAPAVRLAAAVVAALDGVFNVTVGAVIVDLLAAGGVNTTLGRNGVRATRGVMVGETLTL